MPNPLALAIMGGSIAGGAIGYSSAAGDPSQDLSDKAGSTVMSAITGGVLGGIGSYLPWKAIGRGAAGMGKVGMGAGRALKANPMRAAMKAMGREKFSIPKPLKGPLGLLALTAAAIGITAMGAKGRVPNEREEYADSSNFGMRGQGVKERMGLLGATGDMVFGLNNSRHG